MHSYPESVGDHSTICFMREVGMNPLSIFESRSKQRPISDWFRECALSKQ